MVRGKPCDSFATGASSCSFNSDHTVTFTWKDKARRPESGHWRIDPDNGGHPGFRMRVFWSTGSTPTPSIPSHR